MTEGNAESDRRRAALRALEQYRERPRAVEAGKGVECLIDRAAQVEDEAMRHRRRNELVEEAEEAGIPHTFAEEVYDVARQEGVEPAFAFELVRCRVGVRELEDDEAEPPATDPGRPDWVGEAPSPDAARRERRLRASFRRLRALLEGCDTAEEALTNFAKQPDVGEYGY